MKEVWKVSSINNGYEVSSLGRIRSRERVVESRSGARTGSYSRTLKAKLLSPFVAAATGYLQVRLGRSGRQSVHRLVALEFCPGFEEGRLVNHKNGQRDDNRAENLEWVTASRNVLDGYERGRTPVSEGKTGHDHFTSKPVVATCLKTGAETYYECAYDARHAGFDSGSISKCCHGKQKSHKGHAWRFALGGTHRAYAENDKEARQ